MDRAMLAALRIRGGSGDRNEGATVRELVVVRIPGYWHARVGACDGEAFGRLAAERPRPQRLQLGLMEQRVDISFGLLRERPHLHDVVVGWSAEAQLAVDDSADVAFVDYDPEF